MSTTKPAKQQFNLEKIRHLYPFRNRYLKIKHSMEGVERESIIHYLDEGEGEPIVFLHGNPTWSFYFRKLIKSLRSQYRCIAIDHLGCGLSEKNWKGNYRLEDRVALVEELLESLDVDKCHLVVHDWGGAIGIAYAVRNPDKIASVVVTNTAAFPSDWISWRINLCRLPMIGRFINYRLNGFLRAAMHMASVKPLKKQIRTGYMLPYKKPRDRESIDQFVKDIPMNPNHPSYAYLKETEEKLGELDDSQILLLWGMQDFCFTPYFLKRWRETFPKAKAIEFKEAGHFLFEDNPQESLTAIREFLPLNSFSIGHQA